MTRKILSLVVAALLVLALVPFSAAADDTVTVTLTAADVWGDGSGYQMLLDADANAYGTTIPETGPLTTSGDATAAVYAEFEYKIPTDADGAMNTANMVCDGTASITIPAGTYDWCITNPTPDDRIWIASDNGTGGGRANDFVFEAGHEYEFRVSMGTQNDRTDLYIDGVLYEPPAPPLPDGCMAGYYFERDSEQDHYAALDLDGDNYTWYWESSYAGTLGAHEGNGVYSSASYASGVGSLSPDNWLFFEPFTVPSTGATVTFWATGYSSYYYAEPFEVYAVPMSVVEAEGFPANLSSLTPIIAETEATYGWQEYTGSFAGYEGQEVYLAIRHFDCSDIWRLSIDQVEIWGVPDDNPPTPTYYTVTFVDGLTNDVISTVQVEEGQAAVAPTAPAHEGYNFTGWDVDFSNVTSDLTVTAQYEAIPPAGLLGDVDCNGVVDMSDISMLFSFLNGGSVQITDEGMLNADANEDGTVNIMDISAIFTIIANS